MKKTRKSFKVILVLICLFLLFTSCRSKTIYVPVEKVKTEYIDRVQIDSLVRYDSIFQDRYIKGDTLYLIREKYKYVDRIKLVHDSIVRIDSIQVPYPVVEVKEVNRVRNWQIILMCLGGILIGIIGYRVFKYFV